MLCSAGSRSAFWWLGLFGAWSNRQAGKPEARTYRISADGKSITCLRCGLTSWHPEDVRQVFCGNCHIFHAR
jgi:hypothetical protein